jgi:hypothetical protein
MRRLTIPEISFPAPYQVKAVTSSSTVKLISYGTETVAGDATLPANVVIFRRDLELPHFGWALPLSGEHIVRAPAPNGGHPISGPASQSHETARK